MIISYLMTDNL